MGNDLLSFDDSDHRLQEEIRMNYVQKEKPCYQRVGFVDNTVF